MISPGVVAKLVKAKHKGEVCGLLTSSGCAIPIEERSAVCLTYTCQKLRDIMTSEDKELLSDVIDEFKLHRMLVRRKDV